MSDESVLSNWLAGLLPEDQAANLWAQVRSDETLAGQLVAQAEMDRWLSAVYVARKSDERFRAELRARVAKRRLPWLTLLGAAAALVLAWLVAGGPRSPESPWTIQGKISRLREGIRADEATVLTAPDGSILRVAAGSILMLPDAHRARLVEGALAADVRSPFVLSTDAADLRVTGTRFFVEVPRKEPEMKAVRGVAIVMLFAGTLDVVNSQGEVRLLPGDVAVAEQDKPTEKAIEGLAARFGKHYEPIRVDVKPSIPSYDLPLKSDDVGNYRHVVDQLRRFELDEALLARNGFAAVRWKNHEDFVEAYNALRRMELPVYITSDSVLHLYHMQFDETLKRIEQIEFVPKLTALSKTIVDHLLAERVRAKGSAIDRAIAFYAVGYEMLTDDSEEISALEDYRTKVAKNKAWKFWDLDALKAENEALAAVLPNTLKDQAGCLDFLDRRIAELKKAAHRLELPDPVRAWVDHDIRAAQEHAGFVKSNIFTYDEDFSQYVPRGHYTRGFDLRRYFRAMMWFGRMTFLLKGSDGPFGPFADALVSHEVAKEQTIAACYLTRAIHDLTVGAEKALAIWERVYGVTAFYVGLADDLTYVEYDMVFRKVLGEKYAPDMLNDEKKHRSVLVELAKLRKPAIYSGTGAAGTFVVGEPSPAELDKALSKIQGFRFMGQRFVPDSYAMGRLVFPTVADRYFPRGLDVMALLGSKRAAKHLDDLGDTACKGYDKAIGGLKKEFSEIKDPEGWNANLYWSWLYTLKPLLAEVPSGYQTYMRTPAWSDKQLTAALGSWAQLRHDTILYVKQSYTMKGGPERTPKDFPGYVEPIPEFYARLLALARLTRKVLSEMQVLDDASKSRIEETEKLLARLLEISKKELENKALSKEDEGWIKNFDASLKNATTGFNLNALRTTLVADVHTDQNSGQVLEEGTGPTALVVVANLLPDGAIGLAVGPVFTYYEFKQPMADRLTDEKWRGLLRQSPTQCADKMPEFVRSYVSGVK